MDPLCDPLTTRPIQTGWEFAMEPYRSGQFGFIDDPDRQFGNGSVWTRTRTRSDVLEPLLTLAATDWIMGRRLWKFDDSVPQQLALHHVAYASPLDFLWSKC